MAFDGAAFAAAVDFGAELVRRIPLPLLLLAMPRAVDGRADCGLLLLLPSAAGLLLAADADVDARAEAGLGGKPARRLCS